MNASFGRLASLELRSPYFTSGLLRDARFHLADDGLALLRAGRLQTRLRDGVWHLLVERNGSAPRVALADGRTLWLGIQPGGGSWAHVTRPLLAPGQAALVVNGAAFGTLDPPRPVQLASGIHVLALASAARPVTVTLRRGPAEPLAQQVVRGAGDGASLDLRALPEGLYEVEQDDGNAPPVTTTLLVHAALHAAGVPLVAGLRMSAALYGAAQPPVWHVDFAATSQRLEYYVVARNFAANEFSQLQVSDQGFNADGRPPILFDRLEQAALDPAQDLTPALMGAAPGARIALFRSRAPVARRERARRRLQLARNGDVLIDHLPQPDASRATSQFVIHLSKP